MNNIAKRSTVGVILFFSLIYLALYHNVSMAFLLTIATAIASYELLVNIYKDNKTYIIIRSITIILLNLVAILIYVKDKQVTHYQYYVVVYPFLYMFFVYLIHSIRLIRISRYDILLAFYFVYLPNLLTITSIYFHKEVFSLILIVTIFDTSAFFIGKYYGQHYPFPELSKKSLEGYIGGWIMTVVLITILSSTISIIGGLNIVFITIITLFAAAGDLLESAIKRSIGVKDSGKILPGHGGVMDRMDSLLFANLAIYFYSFTMIFF